MSFVFEIVPFDAEIHTQGVIELWRIVFGYESAHNDPSLAIQKKLAMDDGLFFVATSSTHKVAGTVMCGYDGHRGWLYALAVLPDLQRNGMGAELVKHAERALERLGCMKINLQIVEGNESVQSFYESLGYLAEKRISMGKRINANISNPAIASAS